MKKVFNSYAIDILPASGGFIVIEKKMEESRPSIHYQYAPTSNPSAPRAIMRKAFLESKFRDNHEVLSAKVSNYLLSRVAWINEDTLFTMTPFDGNAQIMSSDGTVRWSGDLHYHNEPPKDVVAIENCVWCSYSDNNTLIRYNLKTMREELRIGGPSDTAFHGPGGLWYDEDTDRLLVCNLYSQNIVTIDRHTFKVKEYAAFKEPVYRYLKVGPNEIIRLDSGVYIL